MFKVLHKIHLNCDVNKMTSANLAIVFSPNFLAGADPLCDLQLCGAEEGTLGIIVKTCIENYDAIFCD